jgi:hypothetical protein
MILGEIVGWTAESPGSNASRRGVGQGEARQFLTVLSDLVILGERGLIPLRVLLARVDIGLRRLTSGLANARSGAGVRGPGFRERCRLGLLASIVQGS